MAHERAKEEKRRVLELELAQLMVRGENEMEQRCSGQFQLNINETKVIRILAFLEASMLGKKYLMEMHSQGLVICSLLAFDSDDNHAFL